VKGFGSAGAKASMVEDKNLAWFIAHGDLSVVGI
jgi:hypothetical protein